MDGDNERLSSAEEQRLAREAVDAIAKAYAPYSGYPVGAAVQSADGGVYVGSNVENSSYGLTVCAERVAIFSAVATEGPSFRLRALAVATEGGVGSPCGACRQVAFEFGPSAFVYQISASGSVLVATTVDELLPRGFVLPTDRRNSAR